MPVAGIRQRVMAALRQPLFGTFALAESAVCAFGDALGLAQAQHTPLVQNLVTVGFLQRPAIFLQSHCRSVFLLHCHEVTTDGGGGSTEQTANRMKFARR